MAANLSPREEPICRRLRQARLQLRLSQAEFANQIGISRGRLSSYEDGRAPLRADLALRACHQFIIGEEWLATGRGKLRGCLDLAVEPIGHRLPVDAPYGDTYDKHLAAVVAGIKKQTAGGDLRVFPRPGDSYQRMENLLLFFLDHWLRDLPAARPFPSDFASTLCASLIARGYDFVEYVQAFDRVPQQSEQLDTWLSDARKKAALKDAVGRERFIDELKQRIRWAQAMIEDVLQPGQKAKDRGESFSDRAMALKEQMLTLQETLDKTITWTEAPRTKPAK